MKLADFKDTLSERADEKAVYAANFLVTNFKKNGKLSAALRSVVILRNAIRESLTSRTLRWSLATNGGIITEAGYGLFASLSAENQKAAFQPSMIYKILSQLVDSGFITPQISGEICRIVSESGEEVAGQSSITKIDKDHGRAWVEWVLEEVIQSILVEIERSHTL